MAQYIHSFIRSFIHPPIPFQFVRRFFCFFYFTFHSFVPFSSFSHRSSNNSYIYVLDSHANINSIVKAICSYYSLMPHGMSDESRQTYGDGSKLKVRRCIYFLRKTYVRSLGASSYKLHFPTFLKLKGFILSCKVEKENNLKMKFVYLLLLLHVCVCVFHLLEHF